MQFGFQERNRVYAEWILEMENTRNKVEPQKCVYKKNRVTRGIRKTFLSACISYPSSPSTSSAPPYFFNNAAKGL